MSAAVLFWIAAGIVGYAYAGYPVFLWLLARLCGRPVRKADVQPTVSILVAAFNEAAVIESKIRNCLDLDYPPDRLELVIASDGSTDNTVELARRWEDGKRVRLLDYPVNRGKITVLNETVPHLRGEIVVFSDASSLLRPNALRKLMASFADPRVGGVSGVYQVRQQHTSEIGAQEDLYWKYETFIKEQEASIASVLGAHGSLYAIRKDLYPFPAARTINDDYVIPVRIVQQGYRVGYEPTAVAYEDASEMSGFSRRVRIMRGNLQQLREFGPLLRPFRPLMLFFFVSHKALRLLAPICMLVAAITNAVLLPSAVYTWMAVVQAMFYAVAVAGSVWKLQPKWLRLPYYFCMINLAALVAMYAALWSKRDLAWKQKPVFP